MSKFYQNTGIFQPEGLIKREEQQPTVWQPLEQGERPPFKSAVIQKADPPETSPPASPGKEQPATQDDGSAESPASDKLQSIEDDLQTGVDQKPEQIDLSLYLERRLAEEQIEEAYQRGLLEGKEKVEQDFDSATRALLISSQQLDTIRETIISNSSEELQEFALTIAEKILRVSVREQDRTIIATIEEALRRAVKSDEFTVYIHPDDYECVSRNSAELIAGLTGLNKIVVKKGIDIERGGAKIESDNCIIDATILSQFELIRAEAKKG